MRLLHLVPAVSLALALSACGSSEEPATDTAAADAPAADTAAPPEVATTATATTAATGERPASFAQCAVCHATEAGKNMVGPSLAGVFGRQAGTVAGYSYSAANKDSHMTWDEASLDAYLTAPAKAMPGTKMAFAGMPDAAKRAEVIAYLKTLK